MTQTNHDLRPILGLVCPAPNSGMVRLLDLLMGEYGFSWKLADDNQWTGFSGLLIIDAPEAANAVVGKGIPSLTVYHSEIATESSTVRFADTPLAPKVFRNRQLSGLRAAWSDDALDGTPLVSMDGHPLWSCKEVSGVRHDRCAVSREWFQSGDCLFEHLCGNRLLELLPLLEWLGALTGRSAWQSPPLRACFMLDDPNLHSIRYGFVSFDALADEGARCGFHTAIATVPLDAYYVNARAARIFRENPETLSLLIHGNNHIHRELARAYDAEDREALVSEALKRISRLERRAGFTVSKVMAPPHGACNEVMMAAMSTAGFEAVCISHGSARSSNRDKEWTHSLGLGTATMIAGLPVIPRFPLKRGMENRILLAAYLGQPIIAVGHHISLIDGLGILKELAYAINGVGNVSWTDMETIARSNFWTRRNNDRLDVRLYARNVVINVPHEISELRIEAPWHDPERDSIRIEELPSKDKGTPVSLGELISITPGTRIGIRVCNRSNLQSKRFSRPSRLAPALGRRALVEIRDRTLPWIQRIFNNR